MASKLLRWFKGIRLAPEPVKKEPGCIVVPPGEDNSTIVIPADFKGDLVITEPDGMLKVITFFGDHDRQPHVHWWASQEAYDEFRQVAAEWNTGFWNKVLWNKK